MAFPTQAAVISTDKTLPDLCPGFPRVFPSLASVKASSCSEPVTRVYDLVIVDVRQDERPDEARSEALAVMSSDTRFTDAIVGWAALQSGRSTLEFRPQDPVPLSPESVESFVDAVNSTPLVLTVNDEREVNQVFAWNLRFVGYRVVTALDGLLGVARCLQMHPDVVLLDVMMPMLDGWMMAEILRTLDVLTDIPIVFASTKVLDEDIRRGLELGDEYLTMPLNPLSLPEVVKRHTRAPTPFGGVGGPEVINGPEWHISSTPGNRAPLSRRLYRTGSGADVHFPTSVAVITTDEAVATLFPKIGAQVFSGLDDVAASGCSAPVASVFDLVVADIRDGSDTTRAALLDQLSDDMRFSDATVLWVTSDDGMPMVEVGGRAPLPLSSEAVDQFARGIGAAPLVLTINDEPDVNLLVTLFLRPDGYRIATACDGLVGVARCLQLRPDLVLLNVGMPMLDGWQTAQVLRTLGGLSDIPFIFLTARASPEHERRGRALGCADYLTVPVSPFVLQDAVAANTRTPDPVVWPGPDVIGQS